MAEKAVYVKLKNPSVEMAEQYVRMVGAGDLQGCILIGPPGMGKTRLVQATLDDMNIPYVTYGGHITLAEIYEFLFENSERLIFFDDVSQVINKIEIMEMLKQALQLNGDRELNYRSKNVLSGGVPNKFSFTGRIIFSFNTMDSSSPNVKAIMDRAPVLELRYSRKEVFDAFREIVKSPAGGLMEYEKVIVVDEIEEYTDSSMDVSIRKLFTAFSIYRSAKKLFGDGNEEWKKQVHQLFGKRKEPWQVEIVREIVGDGRINRTELAKTIALRKDMSLRNAQRKITDMVEMEQLFQNKLKGGDVSVLPVDKWKRGETDEV